MKKSQLVFPLSSLGLLFALMLGCGVKSKPLPPEAPIFLGQKQRSLEEKPPNLPESLRPELIDQKLKEKQTIKTSKETPPAEKKRSQ